MINIIMAASFLTRGKYSCYLADDDYYDIEKFSQNMKSVENNFSLLTRQVGVYDGDINEFFTDFDTIERGNLDQLLKLLIVEGRSFDYFEHVISPSHNYYIPVDDLLLQKYILGLRCNTSGVLKTSKLNHYHRVDSKKTKQISNNTRVSSFQDSTGLDQQVSAIEIFLSYLQIHYPNNVHEIIEHGRTHYPNKVVAGYYRSHFKNYFVKRQFIRASYYERRANLYFPEDSIVCDFFLLFICAEVFLKWLQQLFFIKQIVIPYQSLADFKEFFQACGFIKPNCLNAFSVSNFYDFNQQSHRDMAFIVLTLEEKKKIAAEGFTYPGLIFAIEEIHDFYKIASEPFNWQQMKQNLNVYLKAHTTNAA